MDGRPYFSLFSDETRFSRLLPRSAKGWKPYLDRQSLGAGEWFPCEFVESARRAGMVAGHWELLRVGEWGREWTGTGFLGDQRVNYDGNGW